MHMHTDKKKHTHDGRMSLQPAPTLANSFECTYVGICIFSVYEVRTSYIEFDTSYADIAVRLVFDEMRRVPLFGFDSTQKKLVMMRF